MRLAQPSSLLPRSAREMSTPSSSRGSAEQSRTSRAYSPGAPARSARVTSSGGGAVSTRASHTRRTSASRGAPRQRASHVRKIAREVAHSVLRATRRTARRARSVEHATRCACARKLGLAGAGTCMRMRTWGSRGTERYARVASAENFSECTRSHASSAHVRSTLPIASCALATHACACVVASITRSTQRGEGGVVRCASSAHDSSAPRTADASIQPTSRAISLHAAASASHSFTVAYDADAPANHASVRSVEGRRGSMSGAWVWGVMR